MAAIISDKFRIFNAQQFLESLSEPEGGSDTSEERTRMYFFVGRPQAWNAYLEIYSKNDVDFRQGDRVYVGSTFNTASFKATVAEVHENSLLLALIQPLVTSTPPVGSTLKGSDGTSDTGAVAITGVYRYSTNEAPPVPLDNQKEKYDIYDDIIAAKRITSSYARPVIRRFNWDLTVNPKFDMWKPDYSATPSSGGQIGKQSATGASTIGASKFYVMNSSYDVFKCLYNGETPANPNGQNATYTPSRTPSAGQGTYSDGIYKEPDEIYIWKYLYTIPTDDVLSFLSTDFMPIVEKTNASRIATETAAVDGAIDVVLIEDAGTNLPTGTFYSPIVGDGVGGKVELTISGGAISAVSVINPGSGYTYASVLLKTGGDNGVNKYGLFGDIDLTTPTTVASNARGALEPVIPPQGGHGSNLEEELNSKRIMLNIRLVSGEGFGDFPVDNDFRRIGIIKDPILAGTTDYSIVDTLSGLYSIKFNNKPPTNNFFVDELISQQVAGGTAYGTVVSFTLDEGSESSGILKYIQTPDYHTDNGVVRPFESNPSSPIVALSSEEGGSAVSANVDTSFGSGIDPVTSEPVPTVVSGSSYINGISYPEIENNSGEIIYIENRRLITRAPDQIEDIKLVIEF
jgi:hypothetical protein